MKGRALNRTDIVMIGFPEKDRKTYAITWATEKGRRWMRRNFRGDGMKVDGHELYHLGRRRLVEFVGMVLTTHGLTHRTVEL